MSYLFTCPGCGSENHVTCNRYLPEPDEVCPVCYAILHPGEALFQGLTSRIESALKRITSAPDCPETRELGEVERAMINQTWAEAAADEGKLVARRAELLVELEKNVKWRLFRAAAVYHNRIGVTP